MKYLLRTDCLIVWKFGLVVVTFELLYLYKFELYIFTRSINR